MTRTPQSPSSGSTLLVLLGVALAVRVIVFSALSRSSYLDMLELDMKSYHELAQKIAAGQLRPTGVFYQSPLYAYFLGALYWLFGSGLWVPRIANALLGVASTGLLFLIGCHFFSRRVGTLAALALTAYGPLLLEEYSVLKTALVVFLLLLSLALIVLHQQTRRRDTLVGAGVAFGLLCTAAGQFLVALPLLAISLMPGARRSAAIFLLGSLLPLLPVVAWNSHAGGGLLLTSADAGLNLYMGNNARSGGLPARPRGLRDHPQWEQEDAQRIAEQASGRQLTAAEVSRYFTREALSFVRSDPKWFLRGIVRKFAVLWNAYEVPDDRHYSFVRGELVPLLWLLPTFALVGPLALCGMLSGLRSVRPLLPIYAVTLSYLGALILFYVRGRYRLAATPMFALFAAAGLDWIIACARSRRIVPILTSLALLAASSALVNRVYREPAHHGWQPVALQDPAWFDDHFFFAARFAQSAAGGRDIESALSFVERGLAVSHLPARRARLLELSGHIHHDLYRREHASLGPGARPPAAGLEHLRKAVAAYGSYLALGYGNPTVHRRLAEARQILHAAPP